VAEDEVFEGKLVTVERRGDQNLVGPGHPRPYSFASIRLLRARSRVPLSI
jgi:hypothetical protein